MVELGFNVHRTTGTNSQTILAGRRQSRRTSTSLTSGVMAGVQQGAIASHRRTSWQAAASGLRARRITFANGVVVGGKRSS